MTPASVAASKPAPLAPCAGEGCRAPVTGGSGAQPPGSSIFSGPGNLAPAPAVEPGGGRKAEAEVVDAGAEALQGAGGVCEEAEAQARGVPGAGQEAIWPPHGSEEVQVQQGGQVIMRISSIGALSAVCAMICGCLLFVSPALADFGIQSVSATAVEADGSLDLQAGSHPFDYKVSLTMNQDEGGSSRKGRCGV